MKSIISKISATFLGVLILFSSFGFTVSTHLCGGQKVKSAVGFVKSELTCGMKLDNNRCPKKNQLQNTCCQNIHEYHHIEDNVIKEKVEIITTDISPRYFDFYPNIISEVTLTQIYFNVNPPPLLVRDVIVFHQTFLI